MPPHIYTTYVSGILGLVGGGGGAWDSVVDAKKDNMQLKNLTLGGKYSISKYNEASTVHIYIYKNIVTYRRGWTTIYPALSVFLRMYSTENSTCSW